MMSKKFTLSASVLALVASATMVQADAMADLEAAAKAEGMLTTIALPHSWCGYGDVIAGFKAKYPEIAVNELNPDAGSADEVEAIKANKDNTGPQAPDVVDVGLAYGPQMKAEGLIQPYKVSTWDEIPDNIKDAEGYWYGDYYGVMSFIVNKDLVANTPADWADLTKPEYAGQVALAGDPRAVEPGDPRRSGRGPVEGRRCGRGSRQGGPRLFRRTEQGGQLRSRHRQGRHRGAGRDPDRRRLGL